MTVIIAFDPGLKGGVAVLGGGKVEAWRLPTAGKDLDLSAITEIMERYAPTLAIIEKVGSMPGQGVASTFKFGAGYGALLGICAGQHVPVELVTPQRWKKSVLAGTAKDKDAAIAYCRRVFPHISLIPPRCSTPQDGIADALCILEFGRREFLRTSEIA